MPYTDGIEEGYRQKRRQRTSLLFGGRHWFNSISCRTSYFPPESSFFNFSWELKTWVELSLSPCAHRGRLNSPQVFSPHEEFKSVFQTAVTTFAYSSVFILLLWLMGMGSTYNVQQISVKIGESFFVVWYQPAQVCSCVCVWGLDPLSLFSIPGKSCNPFPVLAILWIKAVMWGPGYKCPWTIPRLKPPQWYFVPQ